MDRGRWRDKKARSDVILTSPYDFRFLMTIPTPFFHSILIFLPCWNLHCIHFVFRSAFHFSFYYGEKYKTKFWIFIKSIIAQHFFSLSFSCDHQVWQSGESICIFFCLLPSFVSQSFFLNLIFFCFIFKNVSFVSICKFRNQKSLKII
jgi:hypothetical protein